MRVALARRAALGGALVAAAAIAVAAYAQLAPDEPRRGQSGPTVDVTKPVTVYDPNEPDRLAKNPDGSIKYVNPDPGPPPRRPSGK